MRRTVVAVLLALVASTVVVAYPAPEAAAWPRAGYGSDWDGDGYEDLLVDDMQGRLWLYRANWTGGFEPRQQIGSGWQTFDEVRPVGDWNGDGNADLVARQTTTGDLCLYLGNGASGFLDGCRVMGRGWMVFRELIGVGDWTGDFRPDVVAVRRDTGALILYPGNGAGGFLASRQIGAGWQARDALTSVGDWDEDGKADFLARNTANGDLLMYAGDGAGGFLGTTVIGRGWQGFTAILGIGDFTSDHWSNVLARNRAGELLLYRGDSGAGFMGAPTVIGTGWNAFELNAPGVMPAPAGTAAAALAALPVAAENRTGYAVRAFPHWIDADRDCQNTGNEVLLQETNARVQFHDIHTRCRVMSGSWTTQTEGEQYGLASSVAVAFGVPLAEAWDSGARAWTTSRRQAFANDLGYAHSLSAMTPAANTARADKDPAQWQPSWVAARCGYAARWVAVKYRWRLSVDPAERTALSDVLTGTCGLSKLTLPPRA